MAMQRRLQLIILAHVWVLVPLALAWLFRPEWRGSLAPGDMRGVAVLNALAALYLLARTGFTLVRWTPGLVRWWPWIDVTLVTAALILVRNPTDAIALLYFIPIASAAATLDVRPIAFIAAAYVLAVLITGAPWTIAVVYRIVIVVLVGSMYGSILRLVASTERAKERAEYRTALAREIHDGIQHLLVTMGTRLELAQRLVGESPDRAARIVGEERVAARRAADELRYLVRRLRISDAHSDLATALRTQIAALAERWPFNLELDVPAQLPRLAPAAEHTLLRVIQECLTNAAKHARASSVEVVLAQQDGVLTCSIRDDGEGFEPGTAAEGGVAGLRERVKESGGSFTIASSPGAGTTVTATFPLPRNPQ